MNWYNKKNKLSTNTSIRISVDLKKISDDYADINPEYNLSKFVEEKLSDFFQDEMHLSEYLKYLKNEMKNVKKTIKESRKMKEITKINEKKIEIKKLNKFRDDLTDKEREYWVKALTAIERNPKYLKGQYNTYRNSIDPLITYNRYTNLYIMAKKIREQEEIKVNNSLI